MRYQKLNEERMSLWEQGYSDVEIAKATGCALSSAVGWRLRHGLPSQRDMASRFEGIPLRMYRWREHLGMTLEAFGRMLGRSTACIYAWENGKAKPPMRILLQMEESEKGR